MKKLFYIFMLCAITLISCEKDDEVIDVEGHSCDEWLSELLKNFGPTACPTPSGVLNVVEEEGIITSFETKNPAYISEIVAYYAQPDGKLDNDKREIFYPFGIGCSAGRIPPSIGRIEAMSVIEMEGITIVRVNENRYTVTIAPNSGWGKVTLYIPTVQYNKKAFTTFDIWFEGQRFVASK
jgi:hypothetical protein